MYHSDEHPQHNILTVLIARRRNRTEGRLLYRLMGILTVLTILFDQLDDSFILFEADVLGHRVV